MVQWTIEMAGDKMDLQTLTELALPPDLRFTEENGRYYLQADEFNLLTDPQEVRDCGNKLIEMINGFAQLEVQHWQNISFRVLAREESHGPRTQFLFAPGLISRSRVGGNDNGEAAVYRTAARQHSNVEKALRFWGSREHSWSTRYVIFEIIESDMGGANHIVNRGWCSLSQIKSFKHTANSVSAAGEGSRHGKEGTDPPRSPMSLDRAREMIGVLIKQWVRAK